MTDEQFKKLMEELEQIRWGIIDVENLLEKLVIQNVKAA